MSSTAPKAPPADCEQSESTTRERILRLVVESGPVSVLDLAGDLALSAAGVRRHVAALEEAGQIVVHRTVWVGPAPRGRPARRYVATDLGQAALSSAYSDLAAQTLRYLDDVLGESAVTGFADRRAAELRERHAGAVQGTEPGTASRVEALARSLAGDGYASSSRPVPGGRAVQLCQGHCPVRDVAAQFPQLCEAETRVFSDLLGVHVQRLSTLAAGGHVCTTHVPLAHDPGPGATRPDRTPADLSLITTRAASDRPRPGTVEGTR